MPLRLIMVAGMLLGAAIAAACGSDYDDDGSRSPTPSPPRVSATPEPSPTPLAEPTTDAGISAIEAIISAAVANDIDTLVTFIRYTPTACAVDTGGSGGPPQCREGEPNGTVVDVLPMTTCEGEWRRADELFFDPVAAGTIRFVDAFVAPDDLYPPGETVLVFTRLMSGIGELGWELVLDGGAIVGVKYGCGETADQLIEFQRLTERVPVGSELPPASGIESVDAAIAAMLSGNVQAIREMLVMSPIECTVVQEGLGAPPLCLEGESDGTIIQAFPVAHCEGVYLRPDEITDELFENVAGFYAAYRATDDGWPPGEYALIFERGPVGDLERSALELIVTDDGVSGVHTGCAMSPETMVEFQSLTDVLIAPVE